MGLACIMQPVMLIVWGATIPSQTLSATQAMSMNSCMMRGRTEAHQHQQLLLGTQPAKQLHDARHTSEKGQAANEGQANLSAMQSWKDGHSDNTCVQSTPALAMQFRSHELHPKQALQKQKLTCFFHLQQCYSCLFRAIAKTLTGHTALLW
eukprot:scaffold89649_cov25-Tisochrysis_lutea.AAC.2